MNNQSELYTLLHHLKSCPSEYQDIHDDKDKSRPASKALIADVYRRVHGKFDVRAVDLPLIPDLTFLNENHLISIQIGCWLFSHERFLKQPRLLTDIQNFLFHSLSELAPHVKYKQWIDDEDRAEEFVRLALKDCDILPDRESKTEAADRFDSLSTIKRQKVLEESNAAIQRMKEIRQRMEEQKAREAANVYGKE